MSIIGKLKAALAVKRLADAIERENRMKHDWQKTLKSAGTDFLLTIAAVLVAYFADPANIAAVLGVVPESVRLALIPLISAALVLVRKRLKYPTNGIKALPVLILCLLPAFASAQEPEKPQDFLAYAKAHASIVSGVEIAGERSEFVSLSLDDDFALAGKVRGFASLSLFSRQRASEDPELPASVDELGIYSAGEAFAGAYWQWLPKLAIECRAGMTFAMVGITGTVGGPVDGSKFIGGCGPRMSGPAGRLSILFGHSGPVDDGAKFYGFIPSTIFAGEFALPSNMALLVDISAGRNIETDKAVTSSRFAVRKRF